MWLIWLVVAAVAFAQIPLFVDCLRTLFPKWRLVRVAGRVNSVLLFLVLGGLAAVAYLYYFLLLYLPLVVDRPYTSLQGWTHILFSAWIFVNMVFNYLFSVFLSPGVSEAVEGSPANQSQDANHHRRTSTQALKCRQCDCHVMYMDHHCPFTGNCVGLYTYRPFLLLLVYALLGLLYALWMTLPAFTACHLPTLLWFLGAAKQLNRGNPVVMRMCHDLRGHSFITVPVAVGVAAVGGVLVWQLLMLCADTSTRSVLQRGGIPLPEVCRRVCEGRVMRAGSRWRVMLWNRTSWYQFLFPLPNRGEVNDSLNLVSKHDNKKKHED